MNVDTSSSPRQEWFDSDYDPSPEPRRPSDWMRLQVASGRGFGKQQCLTSLRQQQGLPKVGEIARDRNGNPIGVVIGTAAHGAIQVLVEGYVRPMGEVAKRVNKLAKQLGIIPDIPSNETVREKALRLAKQPHSMAQDPYDFHYDHRGRRRY